MTKQCGNCLYWRRGKNELASEGVADCRRHSLWINTEFYPQSVRDHWCGDWEPRDKPQLPPNTEVRLPMWKWNIFWRN